MKGVEEMKVMYTLVGSSIGNTAKKFIKQIKDSILNNIYLEYSFGKLVDPSNRAFMNNSEVIEFTNQTMVESISSTSPMRGRKNPQNVRIELLILDDFQDNDDVRTEKARKRN